MASPRMETFCCANRDSTTAFVLGFQPRVFSALCASSAAVSLALAVLQLLPKRRGNRRFGQNPLPKPASSSRILLVISACDVLGCAGIITRSSVWLGAPDLISAISVPENPDAWPEVFCVGSAMWIQLFYSASFWWTFCYAVDVYLVVKRSAGISTIVLYHMITWGLAAMLCAEGVAMLYYPSISSCQNGLLHAVPHYITTYAPMLLVLLVNPVLFSRTVAAVTSLLKGRQGIYTENERRLGSEIKMRFFKIMLVFSVWGYGLIDRHHHERTTQIYPVWSTSSSPVWLPNLVNESLLFYLEMQADLTAGNLKNVRNAALITWFIMGILNPMQGFLNTLAFHGWTGFDVDFRVRQHREVVWDSASTSGAAAGVYNSVLDSTVLYQGHVQEVKNSASNGQQHPETIGILSEGNGSQAGSSHFPVYQGL